MIVIIQFAIFMLLVLIAFPMALGMAASPLLMIIMDGTIPPLIVAQRMFVGVDSLPMLAIPLFLLAGSMMESGGISKRLIDFSSAIVGHLRGGLAMMSVLASMIFAGVSGSSTADVAAVGSITMPAMVKDGYEKGWVATMQACAGTIGPIIPPSIFMIIYGGITGLSIGRMFLGGIVPGIMVGIALMISSYFYARKNNIGGGERKSFKEVLKYFFDSIWALLLPVIIIGGILSGVFTATEAGMIAVLYAAVVSLFVYKELTPKDLPAIFLKSGISSIAILMISSAANIFGYVLAKEHFPAMVVDLMMSISTNKLIITAVIIVFFLFLGCFVDIMASLIIFTPVLQPLIAAYGFDPVHFAVIFIIVLLIGQVTPPVGVVLAVTTNMMEIQMKDTLKYLLPLLGSYVVTLLIIAYIEPLVTFIPNLFYG